MRAKMFVVLLVTLVVAGAATSATASELSWFGLIGTGTDQQEVSARMSLRTTSGVPVGSNEYVVTVPQSEGLRAQVVFAGDGGPRRYQVEYSIAGAPGPDGYKRAEYWENAGWVFEIPAAFLSQSFDVPLHLRVKDLKGRAGYIRILFFKIGTGRRATAAHEALFIRVECAPQASSATAPTSPARVADSDAIDQNFARVESAVGQLSDGQQQLSSDITSDRQRIANLEARIATVESWAKAAIAASQAQPQPMMSSATTTSTTTITSLVAKYSGRNVVVFSSSVSQTLVVWVRGLGGWERCGKSMYLDPVEETWINLDRQSAWSHFMLTAESVIPAQNAQGWPLRPAIYSVAPGGVCNEVH